MRETYSFFDLLDLIYIASSNTHFVRADYNDETKTSLEPGSYHFTFEIPHLHLSNGEYKIVLMWRKRNVKCYTTKVAIDIQCTSREDCFG